ncbi:Hypothetical predicted protein, partial [Pelobates cultripes]
MRPLVHAQTEFLDADATAHAPQAKSRKNPGKVGETTHFVSEGARHIMKPDADTRHKKS